MSSDGAPIPPGSRIDEAERRPLGPISPRAARIARLSARVAAGISIALGGLVLAGWLLDSAPLKGAVGISITIKPNAAVAFLLAGVSLLFSVSPVPRARAASRALGGLVAALGCATLSEHLVGWDLGIDLALFVEPAGEPGTASPGRMGPPACLGFLFVGLGLAFSDVATRGGRHPFRSVPLGATLVALVAITGYAFGSPALYSAARATGIAWPTAAGLMIVSLGTIASRPDSLFFRILFASNVGAMAARRLLVPSVVVPFVLILAYGAIRDGGRLDPALSRAILAVVTMVVLASVVLVTAHRLARTAAGRAEAEKRLRESERELSEFFEDAAVGLHIAGPDGIIVRANRADRALLGYDQSEYVGRHVAEFHADPDAIEDILRRERAGENLRNHPARLRRKDGSVRDVLIDSIVLRDEGRIVHARRLTRDVTEEHRAVLLDRRLSAIVDSSNDAIVGKDLNGIITSWNRAAERMFGYTAAEMTGRSILELIPPTLANEERSIMSRIARGEKVEPFETVRRRKDGLEIDVSLSISPILDARGRVVGASKIARDITERKRIEAEREALLESERAARAEAERAARLRDEFLALVSHELRTPLNGILGWSQYLKRSPIADADVRDGVDAIERGARTLGQLIEDLLDVNRIEAGKMALDVVDVRLGAVVESAMATVRPAADAKGIRVDLRLESEDVLVAGDPVRLQQVVWNLVSNAVKFTPKDGTVEVLVRRTGESAEIVVRDSGAGIDPEFVPRLFERFTQADSSTTRAHGGLGLGLSIVKHIVLLHGGEVRAESDGPGRGATFTVRLPLSARRTPSGPRPSPPLPPPAASRVSEVEDVRLDGVRALVVDDDAESRTLVSRVLAQRGARVQTATGAAEALEVLAREEIDVLLSDIGMPGTGGYEFIRRVRRARGGTGAFVPAVAITAYARSADRANAMLSGFQRHLAKPVEPQELLAVVASLTGRTSAGGADPVP